jgi:hypothetical protein
VKARRQDTAVDDTGLQRTVGAGPVERHAPGDPPGIRDAEADNRVAPERLDRVSHHRGKIRWREAARDNQVRRVDDGLEEVSSSDLRIE